MPGVRVPGRGRAGHRRRTGAGARARLDRCVVHRRAPPAPRSSARSAFRGRERMVERSRRSVGATIQAARAALGGEGVAANLAGGTHHAYAHKGSGYCVFNDVAVAARLMQAEHHRHQLRLPKRQAGRGLRVIVIDLDVHQGNGTAAIFKRRPNGLHAVAARGAQLPGAQGGQRPRRRTARRLHRRALPGGAGRGAGERVRALRDASAGPRVLPGRRRPARGRPPRPPEAHRRGAGRARPARLRRTRSARRSDRADDGRRLRPRHRDDGGAAAAHHRARRSRPGSAGKAARQPRHEALTQGWKNRADDFRRPRQLRVARYRRTGSRGRHRRHRR
jgi:hypothetical protein